MNSRNADRKVEEKKRRRNGMFYTPQKWVDYAHKMITEQLGDNWKDEYVVWDNCCGSKNLTRDYRFKELYCSTLFESELEIGKRYNTEGTSFQFDFLNDELEKLPKGLIEAFEENKKIVFFLNPPYAKATPIKGNDGTSLADTMINKKMLQDGMGIASSILYCQFLYRLLKIKEAYNLTNCYIAIFCKPTYLSGSNAVRFREEFFMFFNYKYGMLFNASEFADCSDKWGIHFAIYNSFNGESNTCNYFQHTLMAQEGGTISEIGEKIIYNTDGLEKANNIFDETKKHKEFKYPSFGLKSALSINPSKEVQGYYDAIGYINNHSNCQMQQNVVFLASAPISLNGNKPIFADNFGNAMALFSARKLILDNWINDNDEYLAPNEEHPLFNEFVNDSIVYSLFHTSSNQSSLRQIEYKNKLWDIKNEFFWLSKDEMEFLANEHCFDAIYNDARTSEDRFVYKKLQEITLSKEAQAVLDKATELTYKSFKYREIFSEEHPQYQLDKCWDCSWYQIKALLKEYMKDDLKEFQALYKALGDKMRPMVYELGFLKK